MEEVKHILEFDKNGKAILKNKKDVKRGKKSRANGSRFEAKVRKDLEEKGYIVDKWTNNLDLEKDMIVPAKRKFNPFMKIMSIGTGFPDFIAIKKIGDMFDIIGVESKINGILDKKEKIKCRNLLEKGVFNNILIAKAVKDGRKIIVKYDDFKERYKKYN